jgi:amino acid adenylation domain-containing protein
MQASKLDIPLSFAQERLWFLDQFEPNSPLYNVPKATRIRGRLNRAALEQSINEVVRRHEALRTTFHDMGGRLVQRIAPCLTIHVPVLDLGDCACNEREQRALEIASEESRRPFDLASGPLIRVVVVRLAPADHLLLVLFHHIVSDGWSMGVFDREISALYDAFCRGQASPLPDLEVQYADFAQTQRQWLQGENLEAQVRYWKSQLENLGTLQLPTDRPRPSIQRYIGASESILLSNELYAELQALSRRKRVTLFMTLLSAFKVLLHRYTEQEDIAVATPIAGRNDVAIERLIGLFVNTLVLRSPVFKHASFAELLDHVREVALEAYSNQDLPFEKLVEELKPERNLAHAPLSQVMFALQNFHRPALDLIGCSTEPVELDRSAAKFDLTLQVAQEGSGLRCLLAYNTDLFEKTTITRMLEHWRVLLEGIVANPDRKVSDLPLLTDRERRQLLLEWNDTKRTYPADQCLHELIEEQVEKTPGALAVSGPLSGSGAPRERLTYRKLNARANQLAHHLRKRGIGPESLVGISMQPSADMLVALLGVLKAGAAYVPLDPADPPERLAFMMSDSKVGLVLAQSQSLGVAAGALTISGFEQSPSRDSPNQVRRPGIVCLDQDWSEIEKENEQNPARQARPENLAYVIYTSGSTGRPKGVMIQHRSLVSYLTWVQEQLLSDRAESLPVVTKLGFDASLKQLWPPLLRGHAVWFPPHDIAGDPRALYRTVIESEKPAINCVPSLWEAIIRSERALACDRTLTLLLGGDRLTAELVERSFAVYPNIDLWNIYGPTEATANASAARIRRGDEVTIGRPVYNTAIYLLDPYLNPVPVGVAGEIHIGGDCLARGYLNRPELTAEKFIPNPLAHEAGARLYRTGDRARYLPDGNIQFLGRSDHQVKIRGYRIELGEIEAVLKRHPSVRQAVVMARENTTGGNSLIAYVAGDVEAGGLRTFSKQKLPEYMIPTGFVILDRLPLTPTGKVDREALPVLDPSRPKVETVFVPPQTSTEELLSKIWGEVLKVDRVGVQDNFFDLGGHSLLATQLVSRVRAAFGIDLPLRTLFERPTVADLAAHIDNLLWAGETPSPISEAEAREDMKL